MGPVKEKRIEYNLKDPLSRDGRYVDSWLTSWCELASRATVKGSVPRPALMRCKIGCDGASLVVDQKTRGQDQRNIGRN